MSIDNLDWEKTKMSDVDQIKFSVEQAVLDLGVKIVFPVVKGI